MYHPTDPTRILACGIASVSMDMEGGRVPHPTRTEPMVEAEMGHTAADCLTPPDIDPTY